MSQPDTLGGLFCPFCGHRGSEVKDSRPSGAAIRRRRQCERCRHRFSTFEITADPDTITVAVEFWGRLQKVPEVERYALLMLVRALSQRPTAAGPTVPETSPVAI